MGKLTRIASINDIAEGTMKKYQVDGIEILVARAGGKYYAAQNKCPHFGGELSQGILEENIVTCPRHGSQFNLADGSVVRWLKGSGLISSLGKAFKSPRQVSTYNVKIDGQNLLVEI
jgi:3-phenylpropionate/trans-cinnamate dioxygenase ferredoxin component